MKTVPESVVNISAGRKLEEEFEADASV